MLGPWVKLHVVDVLQLFAFYSPALKKCTVKNIRRFYDKITGNQLPVHFPLFFTGACKHFLESDTEL